jgi:two-component system NtrC family sensor kinase
VSHTLSKFDRDIPLAELLRAVPPAKLATALTNTLGSGWRIEDADGLLITGSGKSTDGEPVSLPLRVDFEVIGRLLATNAPHDHVAAAAMWLEMVLTSAYRYQMAADMHLETVTADYEALQGKHAALQESEERYRQLAGELEDRVKAQVTVIERAQRQLYQTEKMASIGSLSAGMAHEINNPIGFIRSNLSTGAAYFAKMHQVLHRLRHGDSKEAQALWDSLDIDFVLEDFPVLLAESTAGADRITRIVANLKAYATIDSLATTSIDLNDAVRAAAGVIGDQLPDNVDLDLDLQPLPNIAGDQSRMNQVMFALTKNAHLALSDAGGRIKVASRFQAGEIRITVSDNGCGIEQEVRSRIFDPFFTTRDVGKGMGLGLTVCRDIVHAHGGRIEFETAFGAGSTFTVCLPVASAPDSTRQPGPAS